MSPDSLPERRPLQQRSNQRWARSGRRRKQPSTPVPMPLDRTPAPSTADSWLSSPLPPQTIPGDLAVCAAGWDAAQATSAILLSALGVKAVHRGALIAPEIAR